MVITDVVMPEMNGSELSERLRRHVPDLPVLFMSGYTDSAIAHHGVLDPGVPFLHKPFTLPALAAAIRKLLPSGPSPGRTKKSVLIIDDEATFREMVGHSCRRAGHDFADAASSAAALGVLAERRVDVLLVDSNIPGSDGTRVLEAIRAAGYTMPALVLTGDVDSVDCESLRPLGVVQAIEKSADMRPLLKLLDELGAESG